MKIVDNTKVKITKFKDRALESIFRWNGKIFMKVSYDDDGNLVKVD